MSEMGMAGNALNAASPLSEGYAGENAHRANPMSGITPAEAQALLSSAGLTVSSTPFTNAHGIRVGDTMMYVDPNGMTGGQQHLAAAVGNPNMNRESIEASAAYAQQTRGGATAGGGAATGSAGLSPAAQAASDAKAASNRDAYARLKTVLGDYGLESLGDTVMSWLVEGLSESEIVQRMRDTDQFKTRFPAIAERTKKGLSPISPGEYVAYERSTRQMMRAAGIPEGFYDSNDDFTAFLTNDVSLSELGDRVTLAANAAFKMPKEARDALTRWGMGAGDITAFWLDPDKAQPLLERKYAAATLAGASQRSTFGQLGEDTANQLVGWGVDERQAEQGFGTLVQSKELFQSLDQGEDRIAEEEQLGAAFGGNSAAQRRIEQRRRRRQGAFEAGGSFASGQQGVSGLGGSSR